MSMTPSSSLGTLRPDLAAFFEFDLEMETKGYIGTRVFPVVEVNLQADSPGKIPLEQLLFTADTTRTDEGNYNRGSGKFETFSYATKENGWEESIDSRSKARYKNILDLEKILSARAMGVVTRNQEQRVAAKVFDTAVWTGASLTTAISNEWDDFVNAIPITDVEAAVRKVYDGSGLWANALVINRRVFRNLRNCAQIIDRIASSGAGSPTKATDVTEAMLAACFDLDHIIVGGSSKNSANEGQTATPTQIWSDEYASICRVSDSADMQDPCVGRTFHWGEDGSSIGGAFEEYEDLRSRGRIIRVRHDTDEVVMYAQAAHLLSNVTT